MPLPVAVPQTENEFDTMIAHLQKELADHLGIQHNAISYYLKGERVPDYPKLMVITDAGMLPTPTLEQKVKITENAIGVVALARKADSAKFSNSVLFQNCCYSVSSCFRLLQILLNQLETKALNALLGVFKHC